MWGILRDDRHETGRRTQRACLRRSNYTNQESQVVEASWLGIARLSRKLLQVLGREQLDAQAALWAPTVGRVRVDVVLD